MQRPDRDDPVGRTFLLGSFLVQNSLTPPWTAAITE